MVTIVKLDLEASLEKPSVQKLGSDAVYQALSVSFAAGQGMASHKHPSKNVMLHVLTGALELASESEKTIVTQGQVAFFSGDEAHSLVNTFSGQTDVFITIFAKPS